MNTELRNTTDTLQDYLSYIQDDTQVKKIRTGFDKLDGIHWCNVNDKVCADYELKIKNLESEIARYNKGV